VDKPKRYHPVLVTLHWLVAMFVIFNLYIGKFVFPDPDYPETAARGHMVMGILVLLLVIVRFVVRLRAARPADATAGNPLLDKLARVVHYGLYVMLLATTVIGASFALLSGRLARSLLGAGPASGPPPQAASTLMGLHGLSANLLLLLILLHVGAALYHQFIRRDNLIARMWYGPR
jgi:cytochrome b561